MTLHPPADAPDDYAATYDRVRVYAYEDPEARGEPAGWCVDGYDTASATYTDWQEWFPAHPEAIAALPRLVREHPGWSPAGPYAGSGHRCAACGMTADHCARRYGNTGGDPCCPRCAHP